MAGCGVRVAPVVWVVLGAWVPGPVASAGMVVLVAPGVWRVRCCLAPAEPAEPAVRAGSVVVGQLASTAVLQEAREVLAVSVARVVLVVSGVRADRCCLAPAGSVARALRAG